jgi:hypothetical protein
MARTGLAVVGAMLVAACGGPPPPAPPVTAPATEAPKAAGSPLPPAAGTGSSAGSAPAPQPAAGPAAALAIPAGALYACAVKAGGELRMRAIELAPQVSALCERNPEMGPCRYAREACRTGGGRVFAADGKEISRATEAEYDRRVFRVRLQSN